MEPVNIIHLIAYVIIYSFLGWVLETVYKSIYNKSFVNSGFLIGPLCPIYGFGAAIMYLFLNGFKNNILILFIVSIVILTIWEYLVGVTLEKVFKTKYWDYSNSKFNFQGRICLRTSVIWGILGVVFTTIIHPVFIKLVAPISTDILILVEVPLILLIIADSIYSIIKVTNINIGIEKLIEIRDNLKSKMDELKSLKGKTAENTAENINSIISELKEREIAIRQAVAKQTKRLRLAFPTMKLEKMSKLLNKKIDILELLKNDKK